MLRRLLRLHPHPLVGLCIGLALMMLGLSSCTPARAQFPTPPVSLTVAVNTNGVLLSPTNFFAINSNLFRAVVTNTTGWLLATNNPIGWSTNAFAVSGTNVALAPTVYWTGVQEWNGSSNGTTRINEFRVEDVSAFRVANSTDTEISGEETLVLQSARDLSLVTLTNLYLSTPGAGGLVAETNSVLTLLDPTTGRAEWRPVEEVLLSSQTAGKVVSLGTTKRLESTGVDASALATLTTNAAAGWLNPRMYGMTGDGTTDDSAAFAAWSAAIANGQRWLFPAGTYRIATAGQSILRRTNLADVHIAAAPGAKFLMANSAGTEGTSHGVAVFGPSTNVVLDGLHIEWAVQSTNRTVSANWMGFILYNNLLYTGSPIESDMLRNITIRNCSVTRSPGLGFCLAGVDGAVLENNTFQGGLVDAFYIRTSRRIRAVNNAAYNPGDDGFSIATYEYDRSGAALTADYHGEGSIIDGLIIEGPVNTNGLSVPAGVLIGGVRDLSYNNVVVRNYPIGVRLNAGYDQAMLTGLPKLASRGVHFANATFINCAVGMQFEQSTNTLAEADPKWYSHDVTIDGVKMFGTSTHRLFQTQMRIGTAGDQVLGAPRFLFSGLKILNVTQWGSPGTYGGMAGLSNSALINIRTDNRIPLNGLNSNPTTAAKDTLPIANLVVQNLHAREVLIQGLNGAILSGITVEDSPGFGFAGVNNTNVLIRDLTIRRPQSTPEGDEAILLNNNDGLIIDSIYIHKPGAGLFGIEETNNVRTHLRSYTWHGDNYLAGFDGARLPAAVVTNLAVREVNWLNTAEPGTPVWHQVRVGEYDGVGGLPDVSRFRADLAGSLRMKRSFPSMVMTDTGQSSTNGGSLRLTGEPSYSGGFHFAFNSAAADDFTSSLVLLRLLQAENSVAPGSPAGTDLGKQFLAWRTLFTDTIELTSSNTNRFQFGVDGPTDAYLYDHSSARRVWDTQSSGFNLYRKLLVNPGGTNLLFQVDDTVPSADETPAVIFINGALRRVVVGAADSGGTGFRVLRVAN